MDVDYNAYRQLAEFRYRIRQFVHAGEKVARTAGLEPRQHQFLLALRGGAPTGSTVGFLAERLGIEHHSAVELVDRMVNKGLVRRERGQVDRRQVFIHLTGEGEAVLDRLASYHLAEIQEHGPQLIAELQAIVQAAAITNGQVPASAHHVNGTNGTAVMHPVEQAFEAEV